MLPSQETRSPGRPEVKKGQPELNEKGGELIDAFYLALQDNDGYRRAAGAAWAKTRKALDFFTTNTKRCILHWDPYPTWEKGKAVPKPTEEVRCKTVERIDGKKVEEKTAVVVNRANPKTSKDNYVSYTKIVDDVPVEIFEDSDLALEYASVHLARAAS